MIKTFGHARNHSKKFPKIGQTYIFSQLNYHSTFMLRGQYTDKIKR